MEKLVKTRSAGEGMLVRSYFVFSRCTTFLLVLVSVYNTLSGNIITVWVLACVRNGPRKSGQSGRFFENISQLFDRDMLLKPHFGSLRVVHHALVSYPWDTTGDLTRHLDQRWDGEILSKLICADCVWFDISLSLYWREMRLEHASLNL